ncbi:hypothetical protein ACI3EY_16860 [Ornithinimicrobium sp. LYQ92]|uniref:hypothetical protein n=1 Tax=Serinicoccus sp. LYQ92 TaxID=3378798 RepID=UPI0038536151
MAAVIVEGECESVGLLSASATVAEVAAALDPLVRDWVDSSWMHIGQDIEVRYEATSELPPGTHVQLVQKADETTVLMAQDSTVCEVAEALQVVVPAWINKSWLFIGSTIDLRSVG